MTECPRCKGDGREFWVEPGGQRLRMETCQGCGGSGRTEPDPDEELWPDVPTFLRKRHRRGPEEDDGA